MMMRRGLVGLLGVLAVSGSVAAKPPGLPVDPHSEGREPPPAAREFYQLDPPAGPVTSFYLPPARRPAGPLAGLVAGLREAVLDRLTVPLGVATPGR